ncbi:MAG TPA: response regulator [Candidatus Saccharimonadales bacterium]
MSKVLLVEDDNNLREIFEMRLQAEGYETLSAADGEEALMVATKEKPELIIADVMMPKLSGFEMIETLRAAPEMNSVKVIMMTALGQAEDRARGEKLGVVKYLVKSQVTLEDFVRVVREVLPPSPKKQASADAADKPKAQESSANNKQESEQSMQDDKTNPAMPPADDQSAGANPVSGGDSSSAPTSDPMSTAQEQNVVNDQVSSAMSGTTPADQPSMPSSPAPSTPPADVGGMGDSGSAPVTPPAGDIPPVEGPKPDEDAPTPPPAGV